MIEPPKKGKMIYAPREFIGEVNSLMKEKNISKRSDAIMHMTNYAALGRELENLTRFRLRAPPVRQYKIEKKQ